MGEALENRERNIVEEMFGEATKLRPIGIATASAVRAAEEMRTVLDERVVAANERVKDSIGLGLTLGANEAFEIGEDNIPRQLLPTDFDRALGRAGIFGGFAIFDRAQLPVSESAYQRSYDAARQRLEICFDLDPDRGDSRRRTNVKTRTLIPSGETDGPVLFYEPFESTES